MAAPSPYRLGFGPTDRLGADAFEGEGPLSGQLVKFDRVRIPAEFPSVAPGNPLRSILKWSIVVDMWGNDWLAPSDGYNWEGFVEFHGDNMFSRGCGPVRQAVDAAAADTMEANGWRESENAGYVWLDEDTSPRNAYVEDLYIFDRHVWFHGPRDPVAPPWGDPFHGDYDLKRTAWVYGLRFTFRDAKGQEIVFLGAGNKWTRQAYLFRVANLDGWSIAKDVLLSGLGGMVSGALTGGTVGKLLGPVGVVVGAIIGAIVGAITASLKAQQADYANEATRLQAMRRAAAEAVVSPQFAAVLGGNAPGGLTLSAGASVAPLPASRKASPLLLLAAASLLLMVVDNG